MPIVNASRVGFVLAKTEPDLGAVGPDAAVRRVVDLEEEVGAGRDPLGGSLGENRGASPGA